MRPNIVTQLEAEFGSVADIPAGTRTRRYITATNVAHPHRLDLLRRSIIAAQQHQHLVVLGVSVQTDRDCTFVSLYCQ